MTDTLPPMPRYTCHRTAEVHADACPYYIELLVRQRLYRLRNR